MTRKSGRWTDQVTVLAPETVNYDVTLTYYINQDNATTSLAIQSWSS